MKNILITGGSGFIGSNLADKLLKNGWKVTILDNLSCQIHGDSFNTSLLREDVQKNIDFIKGDLRDRDLCVKAIKNQDAIVHLAAETGTGQSMYQVENYADVNIRGTATLLDSIVNSNNCIKKFVLASSRAVYGEGKYYCHTHKSVYPKNRLYADLLRGDFELKCPICSQPINLLPTDEESPLSPLSIYAITKQCQEQMVTKICDSIDIPTVIFRYQNVYGTGQSLANPYTGILPIFSTIILNRNDLNIFEDGHQVRDFVYIDDAIEATIRGLEKDEANNQIFNVGSGEKISVLKIAETLQEKYNLGTQIKIGGDFRLGDIRHNYADLSKIKLKLGFEPKYSLSEGLSKFVAWVKTQEIHSNGYDRSIEELKITGMLKQWIR
jgi:dTDP-L-rhamnose 4-epimerase